MISSPKALPVLAAFLLGCVSPPARSAPPPLPEWIWHDRQIGEPAPRSGQSEIVFLRTNFTVPSAPTRAELKVCGDDEATVFLNGRQVIVAKQKPAGWTAANYAASTVSVMEALNTGANTLAVTARNAGGPYGVILRIEITLASSETQWVISDSSWLTTMRSNAGWEVPGTSTAGWRPARSVGQEGDNPWFGDEPAHHRRRAHAAAGLQIRDHSPGAAG